MDELLGHTPEAELGEEQDTGLEQGTRSGAPDHMLGHKNMSFVAWKFICSMEHE